MKILAFYSIYINLFDQKKCDHSTIPVINEQNQVEFTFYKVKANYSNKHLM